MEKYTEYAVEQTVKLLSIDSPTGRTGYAASHLVSELEKLGFVGQIKLTHKCGVLVCLNPDKPAEHALLLEAHLDTLGGMVTRIAGNRLKITPLGGLNPNNVEGENVRVYTRKNKVYTGVFQLANASVHVNGEYSSTQRSYDNMEVVLDEEVKTAEDVAALGIGPGDFVCFEPRTVVTPSGYIKSRFLDDKLSVGILLALAKQVADGVLVPGRRVWLHFTVFEEVGHGGSASVPEGVSEAISVDMGCVGDGLSCTETQVSICAKDSGGPYHYDTVYMLTCEAEAHGIDYAVDVYPYYGSDVEATLRSGHDVAHGLIGPGVYASHGYERSHKKGVENTLKLLDVYLAR